MRDIAWGVDNHKDENVSPLDYSPIRGCATGRKTAKKAGEGAGISIGRAVPACDKGGLQLPTDEHVAPVRCPGGKASAPEVGGRERDRDRRINGSGAMPICGRAELPLQGTSAEPPLGRLCERRMPGGLLRCADSETRPWANLRSSRKRSYSAPAAALASSSVCSVNG